MSAGFAVAVVLALRPNRLRAATPAQAASAM